MRILGNNNNGQIYNVLLEWEEESQNDRLEASSSTAAAYYIAIDFCGVVLALLLSFLHLINLKLHTVALFTS
jgi:uncharacterized protein YacL